MITLIQTIKDRIELTEDDVKDDVLISRLAELVSGLFEQRCNRRFARTADATFEFSADLREVIPDRAPIESVSKWEVKSNETDGWEEQSDILCLISASKSVITLSSALGSVSQVARVTYTGGYVLPGKTAESGQTSLPTDLEYAAVEQTVYLYQNKNRLGLASVSGQSGSIGKDAQSVVTPFTFLPMVEDVLKKYERWVAC